MNLLSRQIAVVATPDVQSPHVHAAEVVPAALPHPVAVVTILHVPALLVSAEGMEVAILLPLLPVDQPIVPVALRAQGRVTAIIRRRAVAADLLALAITRPAVGHPRTSRTRAFHNVRVLYRVSVDVKYQDAQAV